MSSCIMQCSSGCKDISCCEQEVYKLLTKLDQSKASGEDGISAIMLKNTAASIAPSITKIFNASLATGMLPSNWKKSFPFQRIPTLPVPQTTGPFPYYGNQLSARHWSDMYIVLFWSTFKLIIHFLLIIVKLINGDCFTLLYQQVVQGTGE